MKNNIVSKVLISGVIVFFVVASIVNPAIGEVKDSFEKTSLKSFSEYEETEYWALIFAVGIYKDPPDAPGGWNDRPIMIECANELHEVLLSSPQWEADHIHKVTAKEATGIRLIKELIWLIRNEDSNDMSLIYLTTHGGPLKGPKGNPIDLPPRDEEDGADEVLGMYEGFVKWYARIWDDLLNFFLSLLQSKGVCLIVDSCYAGGFNDEPMFTRTAKEDYGAESFIQGLSKELSGQNRVVLMACEENETSYGLHFTKFLIDGLRGAGDFCGNNDGINSAEEAFHYAKSRVLKRCGDFTPTIFDLYPGEYPITYSEMFG